MDLPSRRDVTVNTSDRALTAFRPTPFRPMENANGRFSVSELNFPPVLICETQAMTESNGMPRP